MINIFKSIIISSALFCMSNTYSQTLDLFEIEDIKKRCVEKNTSEFEKLKSYGFTGITSANLLTFCIYNSTENSLSIKYNKDISTKDLYDKTMIALDNKVNKLRNSVDSESQRLYRCFNAEYFRIDSALTIDYLSKYEEFAAGKDFLRNTLISIDALLRTNCRAHLIF